MPLFEKVEVEWKGQKRGIPPGSILRLIAQVEDVITYIELYGYVAESRVPLAKLAMAHGVILRAAGFNVSDEEVYDEMWTQEGVNMQQQSQQAVMTLQLLMIPPAHLRAKEGASGKDKAATSAESSPPPTASASASNG